MRDDAGDDARNGGPESSRPSPTRTLSVLSLGCRANQEEVECLLGSLRDRGFEQIPFGEPADWIVVNTCSVTRSGESDARQMIRRALRLAGEGRVVVTGCFAQRDPEAAARIGAHYVVGNGEKWRIPGIIDGTDEDADLPAGSCSRIVLSPDPTTTRFLHHGATASGFRSRAALKVQDGCDERCTYCIIPRLRGRSVSRPPAEVCAEARSLVRSGYSEITLTGIHTASYSSDGERLAGLLRRLLEIEGLRRIRVNSLEPQWVDDDLIGTLASSPRFCRHVHLPLQSGDDRILKRMGRGYTSDAYRALVRRIRERIPGVAIGADVIAGFPGEDEDSALRTRRLLEDVRPAYLHVFPYSPRPGTASLRIAAPVPPRLIQERRDALVELDKTLRKEHHAASEGETHDILVEDKRDRLGRPQGTTDTAIRVRLAWSARAGSWVRVRLRAAAGSERVMIGEQA